MAKSVATHELYHAVQGAFASYRKGAIQPGTGRPGIKSCSAVKEFYADLYEEGTAEYVGDPLTLNDSRSLVGIKIRDDMSEGLKHLRTSISLLEMSVISLGADQGPSYDDVYEVGFLGHGTLYSIAYVMARSIANDSGPQGVADLLTQTPYMFVLRYTQLSKYGRDDAHPALGPHTLAAVQQQANDCG